MKGSSVCIVSIVFLAAAMPFALIARSRVATSAAPPLHLIQDMAKQPKYKAQQASPFFADGRTMRPQPAGTLAREDFILETEAREGQMRAALGTLWSPIADEELQNRILLGQYKDQHGNAKWVETIPIPVTDTLLSRGQGQFAIYCTHCHGYSGYGDGMVSQMAQLLQATNSGPGDTLHWTNPASLHDPRIRSEPVGQIYNTITNGIRTMPEHGPQIRVLDRWAITAYVKALQRSQYNQFDDLTAEQQKKVLESDGGGK